MDPINARKQRLHHLIDLARASKGWSRAKLAKALGRDPTKVYPDSGNPKADFIMKLAEVLGWPVGDVMEMVWGSEEIIEGLEEAAVPTTFDELHAEGKKAHSRGEYEKLVELARAMYDVADTEGRKAFACAFEASGWDGLGRYVQEARAAQRGLQHHNLTPTMRNILRADLANAWYSLWDLTPALGTADLLARWYDQNPPVKPHDWKRPAFVHYVRGNTYRRLSAVEPDSREAHARAAIADLTKAAELYERLAVELNEPSLGGIANTARGGILEMEVELGLRSAESAIAELSTGLEKIGEPARRPVGDWLESYGWRCIFGSNVAMRAMQGAELQQAMSLFLHRALEIADLANNWAMRERVFTLQFVLHQRLSEATGLELQYTIDEEDQRLITATMGRFPSFRPLGWQILETAKVVGTR